MRLNIYESGIYIYCDVFADIGYSGFGSFNIKVQLIGNYNISTTYVDGFIINTNQISNTLVEYTYLDTSASTTIDRGEIKLATIGVISGEADTGDENFQHFLTTAPSQYTIIYEKNDFATN
jgi:hypothetical protein